MWVLDPDVRAVVRRAELEDDTLLLTDEPDVAREKVRLLAGPLVPEVKRALKAEGGLAVVVVVERRGLEHPMLGHPGGERCVLRLGDDVHAPVGHARTMVQILGPDLVHACDEYDRPTLPCWPSY